MRVTSKKDTINEGWLCAKGRFGYGFVNNPDRLTKPLIRIAPNPPTPPLEKGGEGGFEIGERRGINNSSLFREVSWEEALDYVANRLKDIKEKYGPDSIGGLASARCTNEENYLFQKFMRAAIGTNNVDHCARY